MPAPSPGGPRSAPGPHPALPQCRLAHGLGLLGRGGRSGGGEGRDPGLQPPPRLQARGSACLSGVRGPRPRAGVTSEDLEDGVAGGSRAGSRAAPVVVPLVCGRALCAMATAPPAPRQPGSRGRSAHLSSHRWRRARSGMHTRSACGRLGSSRGRQVRLSPPLSSRRLWACQIGRAHV